MEYAIFRSGGKQYKVSKGSIIEVDRLPLVEGKETMLDDVLLWVANGESKIGTPKLANVKVRAKILGQIKGDKIRVAKFKAKVRYRRVMGFRPSLTRLQIEDIESLSTT
ncbi:MAG: 50S ribosomal protein L21 [Patescibacteria group bacterium]